MNSNTPALLKKYLSEGKWTLSSAEIQTLATDAHGCHESADFDTLLGTYNEHRRKGDTGFYDVCSEIKAAAPNHRDLHSLNSDELAAAAFHGPLPQTQQPPADGPDIHSMSQTELAKLAFKN